MGKAGSFGGDALEDVIHERVHDAHGFAGDTSVGMNLLQHLVDVDGIAFPSLSSPLLLSFSPGLCLSSFLLAFLSCNFGCHVCRSEWSLMSHRVKNVEVITKSSRDQLPYGSKSSSFYWLSLLGLLKGQLAFRIYHHNLIFNE